MEIKIVKAISYLFHPLLMPTYALIVLLNQKAYFSIEDEKMKMITLGLVFVTTFMFPLIFALVLRRFGTIKSLQMETKEERIIPFFITIIFYYATFYLLKGFNINQIFVLFALGATFLAIAALIVNFWWKISLHMTAMGGFLGAMIAVSILFSYNMIFWIVLSVLISGVVGYARLKLNSHQPAQVYAGFLMGVSFMLLILLI